MDDPRIANLLGALALVLGDDLALATDPGAGRGVAAAALVTVATAPGRPIETYRRVLDLTHSGAVRLVDRLAAAGLVERRPAVDGRAVALVATAAGEARVADLLAARRAALERALSPLTDAERARLTPLLEKMLAHLTTDAARADRICRLCEVAACPQARCPVELAAPAPFGAPPAGTP